MAADKLENITTEVSEKIAKLRFKSRAFGGYDKETVIYNIQEICDIYEKYLANLKDQHKNQTDALIFEKESLAKVAAAANPGMYQTQIEELNRQIAALTAKNTALEQRLAAAPAQQQSEAGGNVDTARFAQLLLDAHTMSDEILRRAKNEAELLVLRAKVQAAEEAKNQWTPPPREYGSSLRNDTSSVPEVSGTYTVGEQRELQSLTDELEGILTKLQHRDPGTRRDR